MILLWFLVLFVVVVFVVVSVVDVVDVVFACFFVGWSGYCTDLEQEAVWTLVKTMKVLISHRCFFTMYN